MFYVTNARAVRGHMAKMFLIRYRIIFNSRTIYKCHSRKSRTVFVIRKKK